MCRSSTEGFRRCKSSAKAKAQESLDKAVLYQAKKTGFSVSMWKEEYSNEYAQILTTYDERLNKFQKKLNETCKPNIKPLSFVAFAERGAFRDDPSSLLYNEYIDASKVYTDNLKLSDVELLAVSNYTYNSYVPINSYLLKKNSEKIFREDSLPWNNPFAKLQTTFKDEEDINECIGNLDSALQYRQEESRIVYRGMRIRPDSQMVLEGNKGEDADDAETRKGIMVQQYVPGSQITFDSYSSASDSIGLAAAWCNASLDEDDGEPTTGVIFEIKSNAGVPVAHLSGHPDEREILLPRGMNFKVVDSYWNGEDEESCYKYKESGGSMKAKNPNTLVVQLVEVDDSGNEITDTAKHEPPPVVRRKFESVR